MVHRRKPDDTGQNWAKTRETSAPFSFRVTVFPHSLGWVVSSAVGFSVPEDYFSA